LLLFHQAHVNLAQHFGIERRKEESMDFDPRRTELVDAVAEKLLVCLGQLQNKQKCQTYQL
jgi:hypothetical protein